MRKLALARMLALVVLGYAQGPSDRPGKTNPSHGEIYAAGAFLLAGTEVYRLGGRHE